MSTLLLRRIAALLLLAIIAWAGLAVLRQRRGDRTGGVQLPRLTAATTDTILYAAPGDTVRLVRAGTGWTVNGFPAAGPVVEAFFRAVSDSSTRSELVAESPASYQRLGVDSLRSRHLTVAGGGRRLLELRFGSRGPDFEGFYVRQGSDPRVFLLSGTFANLAVQPVDDWRDRGILAIAADSIGAVEVERGARRWRLARAPAGWTLAPAGLVDSVKVRRFLSPFATLQATGFPSREQADSATFAPAERQVILLGRSGTPLGRLELDSMPWGWMVRTASGAGLYKLDQRLTDLLTPEAASFAP